MSDAATIIAIGLNLFMLCVLLYAFAMLVAAISDFVSFKWWR